MRLQRESSSTVLARQLNLILSSLAQGELFDALSGEFHTSPAGGAATRLSAPRGKQGSTIRLFAGTDDPLIVAATLDNALRN